MVPDSGNKQVKVLDLGGALCGTYTEPDSAWLIESPFQSPRSVAVDRWGRIWVADSGNGRVVRIDQNTLPKNYNLLPLVKR